MRYAVYVAAAAAIGLLIGFVTLSIGWLRKNVMHSIRNKTLSLLDTYDDLLEEKSRELSRLERELSEKGKVLAAQQGAERFAAEENTGTPLEAEAPAVLRAAERAGTASYRDDALGKLYRMIRENFSFHIGDVVASIDQDWGEAGGPASRLLEALEFDTVYQISTLREEQQAQVLRSSLDGEEAALLEDYLARHRTFKVLEFYDDLKARAEREHQPVRLWVPGDAGTWEDGRIGVLPDDGICEGFQVEIDHLLYDYSIRTRELN